LNFRSKRTFHRKNQEEAPLYMRKLRVSREKYIKVPGVWLKKHPKLEPTTHCHPLP